MNRRSFLQRLGAGALLLTIQWPLTTPKPFSVVSVLSEEEPPVGRRSIWFDTKNRALHVRNAENTAWIEVLRGESER